MKFSKHITPIPTGLLITFGYSTFKTVGIAYVNINFILYCDWNLKEKTFNRTLA
jgi:hypothetical protein